MWVWARAANLNGRPGSFVTTDMVGLIAYLVVGGAPQTFIVDGVKRQAIIVAPTKKTDHPPIVFGWHGHGGGMTQAQNMYKIEAVWPEAVVVYAQGLPSPTPVDPSGTKPGWQYETGQNGDRDLKLFDTLLTKLTQIHSVDQKKVYSVGFSNGGIFTYLLWSQRNAKLAAGGIVAGALMDANKPLKPMHAFVVAGRQDTTCPFQLQIESIRYDRMVDGVAPNATAPIQSGVRYFHGTKADIAIMIHNAGHVYPPGTSQKIVDFFKSH